MTLKIPLSTVHNIKKFRESGGVSVHEGQDQRSKLNVNDLRALRRHCIKDRHDSLLDITELTWAQEDFQKSLSNPQKYDVASLHIWKDTINAEEYREVLEQHCSHPDNISFREGLAYFSMRQSYTTYCIHHNSMASEKKSPAGEGSWTGLSVLQAFHQKKTLGAS